MLKNPSISEAPEAPAQNGNFAQARDWTASPGGTFQGIALGDDLDDEVTPKYPKSSAAAVRERQVASGTATIASSNSAESKPRTKRERSTRSAVAEEDPEESLAEVTVGKTPFHLHMGIFLALLLGMAGIVVSIVALIHANDDDGDNVAAQGASAVECDPEVEDCNLEEGPVSLLETVFQRGYINCGITVPQLGFFFQSGVDSETQEPTFAGLDVDLCRAIAAAIFDGDSEAYRLLPATDAETFWTRLTETKIDIMFRPTRTMQRQVYVPSIDAGVEFSQPYFYDGMGFAGLEEFVECAENGMVNGTCVDLRICVFGETSTHFAVVSDIVPIENIVVGDSGDEYYGAFPTMCNVLAGEKAMIAEASLRLQGYEGEYTVGSGVYSREPLCMVTRQGDKRWTDFVGTVLNTLIKAEEDGITKVMALNTLPTTDLFGPQFERMFQNAVAFGGNYGELYVNNLEAFLPRNGLNELNVGVGPRIFSYPFGDLDVQGPNVEDISPTITAIKEKGFLNCGLTSQSPGTLLFDQVNRTYQGAGVDLCRAISAALFDGVDRTLVSPVGPSQRVSTLHRKRVDAFMSIPHRLEDDVKNPVTGSGFSFSEAYYYPGVVFAGIPSFVDCAERLDIFSIECQSLRICGTQNTAIYSLFLELLRDDYLIPYETPDELFGGLEAGDCNVFVDGEIRVQTVFRRQGGQAATPYMIGTRLFSVVPIAVATRDDDPVWSAFVDWVVMSLIYAEEQGITQETATLMPRTNLFGPLRSDMFYHAVNAVGNYGEIYARNFERLVPRSGPSLLNDNTGPRLFSF